MQTALINLQQAIEKLFQWFSVNYLKAKADKSHLLTSSHAATSYKSWLYLAMIFNLLLFKLLWEILSKLRV